MIELQRSYNDCKSPRPWEGGNPDLSNRDNPEQLHRFIKNGDIQAKLENFIIILTRVIDFF